MNKMTAVRLFFCFTVLALALGVTVAPSHAFANCPSAYCPNFSSGCAQIGCGYFQSPDGQCTLNGVDHNLYRFSCPGCGIYDGRCYT
jgi:hypothetical protein